MYVGIIVLHVTRIVKHIHANTSIHTQFLSQKLSKLTGKELAELQVPNAQASKSSNFTECSQSPLTGPVTLSYSPPVIPHVLLKTVSGSPS